MIDKTNDPIRSVLASDLAITLRGKPGASPGSLVIHADAHPTSIQVIHYTPDQVEETTCSEPTDLLPWIERDGVVWIDIVGLGTKPTLEALADALSMHRLTIEDIVSVHQRPKCEEFGDRVYVVTRMPIPDGGTATEQVSLFLGPGFVATFQERPGDCFDMVRGRIRRGKGKIRTRGPDYLTYAILDAITDAFFPVLEAFGERLEQMEDEALDEPTIRTLSHIRHVKKELMVLRRTLWPMRELFSSIQRDTIDIIQPETRVYLRDCYDHAVQLIDVMENYRELSSGLMDVYMSSTGNRMNEIMKVLTIVATIFIPLTFIAGVYGMNFDAGKSPYNMPELAWRYGYLASLALMVATGLAMVIYFRRIGFIGGRGMSRRG